jgi:hypothetical protein
MVEAHHQTVLTLLEHHRQQLEHGDFQPIPSIAGKMMPLFVQTPSFKTYLESLEATSFVPHPDPFDSLRCTVYSNVWERLAIASLQGCVPSGYYLIGDQDELQAFTKKCIATNKKTGHSITDIMVIPSNIESGRENDFEVKLFVEATIQQRDNQKIVYRRLKDNRRELQKTTYFKHKLDWLKEHRKSPIVSDNSPCLFIVSQDMQIPHPNELGKSCEVVELPIQERKFREILGCPTLSRRTHAHQKTAIFAKMPITIDQFKAGVESSVEWKNIYGMLWQNSTPIQRTIEDRRLSSKRSHVAPLQPRSRFSFSVA